MSYDTGARRVRHRGAALRAMEVSHTHHAQDTFSACRSVYICPGVIAWRQRPLWSSERSRGPCQNSVRAYASLSFFHITLTNLSINIGSCFCRSSKLQPKASTAQFSLMVRHQQVPRCAMCLLIQMCCSLTLRLTFRCHILRQNVYHGHDHEAQLGAPIQLDCRCS